MKRSRIFLGLTTACLAIAGVVAAKASHFNGVHRWYITSQAGACVLQPGIAPCVYNADGAKTCVTTLSGTPFTLYTINSLGVCTHPVKYDLDND